MFWVNCVFEWLGGNSYKVVTPRIKVQGELWVVTELGIFSVHLRARVRSPRVFRPVGHGC